MVYPLAVWKTLLKRCAVRLWLQSFFSAADFWVLRMEQGSGKKLRFIEAFLITDHLLLAQHGNPGDVCEEERLHRTFLLLLILGVGTLR